MKNEFLKCVRDALNKYPDLFTENAVLYLEALEENKKATAPTITENGKMVLSYMQKNTRPAKARDISDRLGIASRTISGALRKLVGDGYVEKISDSPVIYAITDKGKEFSID